MDTTTVTLVCDKCGKAVEDGSYHQQGALRMCIACALAGVTAPMQQALAHDAARKQAECAPLASGGLELSAAINVLAVHLLKYADSLVGAIDPTIDDAPIEPEVDKAVLDNVQQSVEIARMLDVLGDKLLAR